MKRKQFIITVTGHLVPYIKSLGIKNALLEFFRNTEGTEFIVKTYREKGKARGK